LPNNSKEDRLAIVVNMLVTYNVSYVGNFVNCFQRFTSTAHLYWEWIKPSKTFQTADSKMVRKTLFSTRLFIYLLYFLWTSLPLVNANEATVACGLLRLC